MTRADAANLPEGESARAMTRRLLNLATCPACGEEIPRPTYWGAQSVLGDGMLFLGECSACHSSYVGSREAWRARE